MGDRATVIHLSDLHFGARAGGADAGAIADSLCGALRATRARPGRRLLAITGDIFDSNHLDTDRYLPRFQELLARIEAAIADDPVETVILPGNHDRRRGGLVGRFRPELFDALRAALGARRHVHVAGCSTPFLAELLDRASDAIGAHVVAYDSTYLTSGFLSAGGAIHAEDLLQIAPRLDGDRPVLVLLHHHLIPTPVTDVCRIDASSEQLAYRLLVQHALPKVVSFGDREELSMTAFGAGTALSMLHALRRAVLVLHGHKHYPTARVLHGPVAGDGDIVITSAGSAGTMQVYEPTSRAEAVQLWPSFNAVEIGDGRVDVSTTFFSPRDPGASTFVRPLCSARREGARWRVEPVSDPEVEGPPIRLDEAIFSLFESAERPRDVWDFQCSRRIDEGATAGVPEYHEVIECARGAVCEGADIKHATDGAFPALRLRPGRETGYRLRGGLCRSLAWANHAYEGSVRTAFEWVGLLVRHRTETARICLRGLPEGGRIAFGSITDLHTGRQRPHPVRVEGDRVVLEEGPCAARQLLRIHWPLAR